MAEIFAEQIRYHGASSQIGYNVSFDAVHGPYIDATGKIHLDETFLSYLWSICYSSFVVFDEVFARPQLEENFQRTEQQKILIAEAEQLFAYGLGLQSEYSDWPINELPNPEKWSEAENHYVEKTSAAFLQAVVFVMLHEFGHFYLGHLEHDAQLRVQQLSLTALESKQQEQDADNFATQTMMSGVDWQINHATITCGIVVGLGAILFLHNSLDGGAEHPDPQHRLYKALILMDLAPNDILWAFGAVILVQWSFYNNKPIPGNHTYNTYRENFELMLTQLADLSYYEE